MGVLTYVTKLRDTTLGDSSIFRGTLPAARQVDQAFLSSIFPVAAWPIDTWDRSEFCAMIGR